MKQYGTLFIVATPIGNLGDMTQRAVDVLANVDSIAAEDTRHSGKLLQKLKNSVPLVAYHDFSSESAVSKILQQIQAGQSIALISDAGTPLISDPGYKLVKQARDLGINVLPIPGASAVTAALSVAGLPTDKFVFEGFLPKKAQARSKRLTELADESRSMVFYEAPHRIIGCIAALGTVFGDDRRIFIGRELTKKFESHFVGNTSGALVWLQEDRDQQKGEFVIVLAGCQQQEAQSRKLRQAVELVACLRRDLTTKRAVAIAIEITGARKNQLYDLVIRSDRDE
ncbi:MAG TPA: 16S rRNA (cytidine(1402)-2'-O)-methyltransferase [Gammaproteobacteria bacterium]|nr:16S rRNA (cytidine(1402)-2'-O)-methyltransferase [Gammaproteobacteria bacterium]